MIFLTFANTMTASVKKGGPTSLWRESSSLTATVDVIQRGEALAIFERDLIIHFPRISKAAALYVLALFGGIKRALEVYRRVGDTTNTCPWSLVTTEETWHSHAEVLDSRGRLRDCLVSCVLFEARS